VLFIVAVLTFAQRQASACFCVIPEVPEAMKSAEAVFRGSVTDIIEPRTTDPKAPLIDRLYQVKFKIGTSWKGKLTREITIYSAQGQGGCYTWGSFVKGQSYIVYAERPVAGAPRGSLALLFACNRTEVLLKAGDDVIELDRTYARNKRTYRGRH
jgi:hypothetical protein